MRDLDLALQGNLQKFHDDLGEMMLRAHRGALEDTLAEGKELQRSDMRRAGFQSMENTWQDEIYPQRGLANEPAALLFNTAPHIVDPFSKGQIIASPRGGQAMLAVPVPGSPVDEMDDPRGPEDKVDWATKKFGKLTFIPGIPGKRPHILAAEGVGFTATGKATKFKQLKSGGYRKGASTQFLFFLFDEIRLEKRLQSREIFNYISGIFPIRHATNFERRLAELKMEAAA